MFSTLIGVEKLGIFRFEEIFCFPGSFSFGVITPLDIIEVVGLISSDPSLVINNSYWMLWIDKIGLHL